MVFGVRCGVLGRDAMVEGATWRFRGRDAARRVAIKTVGSHRWRHAGQITTRHAALLRPSKNGENRF